MANKKPIVFMLTKRVRADDQIVYELRNSLNNKRSNIQSMSYSLSESTQALKKKEINLTPVLYLKKKEITNELLNAISEVLSEVSIDGKTVEPEWRMVFGDKYVSVGISSISSTSNSKSLYCKSYAAIRPIEPEEIIFFQDILLKDFFPNRGGEI